MTAFAFILGVVPLLIATGAGAQARKVMGMAVFSGMLIATILGVLIVPVFFVMIESMGKKKKQNYLQPIKILNQMLRVMSSKYKIIGDYFGLDTTFPVGCLVGPKYEKPEQQKVEKFKHAPINGDTIAAVTEQREVYGLICLMTMC